jgi:predicted DNA-binding protein with PD1-like motif
MQIACGGTVKRVIALRLAPGEDVLQGLQSAVEKAGINNGIIMSGIGSLNGARYFDPIPLPEKKAKYGYGEALELRGPIELVSLNGMICQGVKGETLFHLHGSFSDQYGNAWGGHLIEGNKVLLTVDVVIGEIDGLHMGRRYDEDLDVFLFNPTEKKS